MTLHRSRIIVWIILNKTFLRYLYHNQHYIYCWLWQCNSTISDIHSVILTWIGKMLRAVANNTPEHILRIFFLGMGCLVNNYFRMLNKSSFDYSWQRRIKQCLTVGYDSKVYSLGIRLVYFRAYASFSCPPLKFRTVNTKTCTGLLFCCSLITLC